MSINKLVAVFTGFYREIEVFAHSLNKAKKGLWEIELIVAMAILTGVMLVLFRFNCNIIALQGDSISRLEALSSVYDLLEGDLSKKDDYSSKNKKFKLNYEISGINIVKSNIPKGLKNRLKSHSFRKTSVIVSWRSQLGQKKSIKILSGKTLMRLKGEVS